MIFRPALYLSFAVFLVVEENANDIESILNRYTRNLDPLGLTIGRFPYVYGLVHVPVSHSVRPPVQKGVNVLHYLPYLSQFTCNHH